ncbi:MAG TPA: hypothetical protein GX707_03200 [Epulopiscium sp.]|nr:hypothetical protein [Candidatus Epulonipiscium sp.]
MKAITKAIQHGVSFAYISLLTDYTNIFTNSIMSTIEEIDPDLNTIIHDMNIYISTLDTLLGGEEIHRSECVTKLQIHHKTLENKFKVINAYSRELNHISTLLENKFHLKTTKFQDIEGINYHQFVHEGLDFIALSKTEEEKIYKKREILRALPMRMTKNSFVDYVKQSLKKIAPNPLDQDNTIFSSVFKQMFDGRLTQDYGVTFHDVAMAIEDLRDQSETDLTGDAIEEMFDDIYLLKDTIEELYSIIKMLHNTISFLCTLLILDSLDFDVLSNEHVAFKDLFFTTKALMTGETHGEDYSIMVETLPDRFADVFDETNENYVKSTEKFYKNLEKGSFPQTEETLKLIKVFSLIQFYLTLNIEDAFSFDELTDLSTPLSTSIIEDATKFLAQELNTLKPAERKLRMQYLISMLPFTMDTQEFATYFDSSLEGTSNEIQKAYVLAKISSFMESLGYFDALESTSNHSHHHDHHHHDDDCGCHDPH